MEIESILGILGGSERSGEEHEDNGAAGRYSRRQMLQGTGAAGAVALTGYTANTYISENRVEEYIEPDQDNSEYSTTPSEDDVWGAMYFPSDAYNAWQIWDEYDPAEIERDMEYAETVNMNAFRVILSYEYWRDNPDSFANKFDHFLSAADTYEIDVLPVLFEGIGDDPTPENVRDKDITSSYAVRSPSWDYMEEHSLPRHEEEWRGKPSPAAFTSWFTETYGDDSRMLAVEIMNEPQGKRLHHRFADDMLGVAHDANTDAPLTMGTREIEFNDRYTRSLDIYQVHHNLPPTPENMGKELQKAEAFSEQHGGKPVWLTEWQRLREPAPAREDWPQEYLEEFEHDPDCKLDRMIPNYESLAPMLRETDAIEGAFMWGLMVKPAYIDKPREQGRINGLFYPDGAVWDEGDARAIAGDKSSIFEERQELPQGMEQLR